MFSQGGASPAPVFDLHPAPADFREDVVSGLQTSPKRLSSMYFYDERGSLLFDQICDLEEYYPTRTEVEILRTNRAEIAERLGPNAMLIELGSGSSAKTHIVLEALQAVHSYVPIDISREHLQAAAQRVAKTFSGLSVQPVCADFMGDLRLPPVAQPPRRKYVLFPGSTIGNFHQEERRRLLSSVRDICRPEGGGLLIGIDLKKDQQRLERAYNDSLGVTADFNLNLLTRINRELDADFELEHFEHRAFYNDAHGRIEMHLVSQRTQSVSVSNTSVEFSKGESICTEYSYKFSVDEFCELGSGVGLELAQRWTDPDELFAVLLFDVK